MNELKMQFVSIIANHHELRKAAISGIEHLWECLQDFDEELEYKYDEEKKHIEKTLITELNEKKTALDNQEIVFNFLRYKCKIKFIIKASKGEGCIQWYHLDFNEKKGREEGMFIMSDQFDRDGNLIEYHMYMGANMKKYFQRALIRFVKTVDEKLNSEFSPEK